MLPSLFNFYLIYQGNMKQTFFGTLQSNGFMQTTKKYMHTCSPGIYDKFIMQDIKKKKRSLKYYPNKSRKLEPNKSMLLEH